jgi:hypothetical protein
MAVFEAPPAHEAVHYSNPEWEAEWETHESHESHYSNPYSSPEAVHYSSPEMEDEWETHESHYSNPYSSPEMEWESHYSNPESEWESQESHYSNPESEWETHESHYSNPYSAPEAEGEAEFLGNILSSIGGAIGFESEDYSNPEYEFEDELEYEDEGEFFFKKLIRRIGKAVGPLAKRLAPMAARALGGMIPGVGAIVGPLAGQLVGQLVKEAEFEVGNMEAEFFGANEMEAEVGHTEVAHEAALTEMLAAEAAQASNEAEAEAVLATALPLTITIMGGRRALRPVVPTLAQANGRLVQVLARQGPAGRQLLRTVPTIQRRAVAILRAASRSGQPITAPLAVSAVSAAARSVLGNPRQVQRAVERNLVLRRRVAPLTPRRAATFVPNRMPPSNARRAAASRRGVPRV